MLSPRRGLPARVLTRLGIQRSILVPLAGPTRPNGTGAEFGLSGPPGSYKGYDQSRQIRSEMQDYLKHKGEPPKTVRGPPPRRLVAGRNATDTGQILMGRAAYRRAKYLRQMVWAQAGDPGCLLDRHLLVEALLKEATECFQGGRSSYAMEYSAATDAIEAAITLRRYPKSCP
jgi:hypothetical protein